MSVKPVFPAPPEVELLKLARRVDALERLVLGGEQPRLVGGTGEPVFQPGWSNFDVGNVYRPARFWKDALGWVHLMGLVTGGAGGANGQPIFFLPAGYRPTVGAGGIGDGVGLTFATLCWNGGIAVFGSVGVHGATSDGAVYPYSGNVFGAGTGIWLDGISFRAA